ncbi:MAG: hypothetical protein ACXAC2_03740 [Candidatus Kariarchaeaceae archaeon]|jgi:hypothetical protein
MMTLAELPRTPRRNAGRLPISMLKQTWKNAIEAEIKNNTPGNIRRRKNAGQAYKARLRDIQAIAR